MDPLEIPKHKTEGGPFSNEARILREHTPDLLVELIKMGAIENIESLEDVPSGGVTALEGGVASACYFMQNNSEPIVVKFRRWGTQIESDFLNAWRAVGVSTPEPKSYGVVPLDIAGLKDHVQYLVLEAIVDSEGKPAPTAENFARSHPELSTDLGRKMGEQLFLMHQVEISEEYGGFEDLWGRPEIKSWDQNLVEKIEQDRDYLLGIEIPEQEIDSVLSEIPSIDFPSRGSYVHGDFQPYNILVSKVDPLEIKVFDPNPIIADPYWDLAFTKARVDFQYLQQELDHPGEEIPLWAKRNKEIVDALFEAYTKDNGGELDNKRLLANLIGVSILRNRFAEKYGRPNDIKARRKALKNYFTELSKQP